MRIVIVGGGKIGYYLSQSMLDIKYDVALVEKDKNKCTSLANDLGIEVINGDGTDMEALIDAGISKADCFVAVTGRDQDNLVACQLVRRKFMVEKVIARVNNPRNRTVMNELGIYDTVSSTEIITRMVEYEINNGEAMQLIASLNKGRASILSVVLPLDFSLKDTEIKDMNLPESCLIVSVVRDERFIFPRADTVLLPGDEIIIFCEYSVQKEVRNIFES